MEEGEENAAIVYELAQTTADSSIGEDEVGTQSAASFAKCVVNKFANSYGKYSSSIFNWSYLSVY
ncbi:hypothetical protein J11TS1_15950 [Oceanobacillus sp. J11TS1]|nr:hypothetical protein J11TS1_15950 [Oceanobacillus sp. J11TS1]